jgi:hypothetical protein
LVTSRAADGELWQPRFFDRALRSVKEYNEKVEYIHLNPVRAGLVSRPEDWRGSSYNEYVGLSAEEHNELCGLIVDRVRMPSDPHAGIRSLHRGAEKTRTTKAVVRAHLLTSGGL